MEWHGAEIPPDSMSHPLWSFGAQIEALPTATVQTHVGSFLSFPARDAHAALPFRTSIAHHLRSSG